MKKLLRHTFIIGGTLFCLGRMTEINPDVPLFLLLFGLPIGVIYTIDSIDLERVKLFLRVSSKYGLVLSGNLYKSFKSNLIQYKQVVSHRMNNYQ